MKKSQNILLSVGFLLIGVFVGNFFKDSSFVRAASSVWSVSGNNIYNAISGRVGIGTSTPQEKLSVKGNIELTDGNVYDIIGIRKLNPGGVSLSIPGNLGIGVDSPSNKLEVAGDIFLSGGNIYNLNGINRLNSGGANVTMPGNLGIGTTSPSEKLEVNGNIKIQSGGKIYSGGDICIGNCP